MIFLILFLPYLTAVTTIGDLTYELLEDVTSQLSGSCTELSCWNTECQDLCTAHTSATCAQYVYEQDLDREICISLNVKTRTLDS
jgi:hypothetical protein